MANTKNFKVKNGIQPTVYHENVGTVTSGTTTVGYNLSGASYDSVSFDISGQEGGAWGLAFNNNGTKMYVTGYTSDAINQYSLSTAFDISTASYDSVQFSFLSQDTTPISAMFNNDGTKMYMVGRTNLTLFQYSLSTAFDVSTASYDSKSFYVGSQDSSPYNIDFNSDGTKMYLVGDTNNAIYQYSLSTGFDLSTASYDSVSLTVTSQDGSPYGIRFKSDGTKLYMIGVNNKTIYQYSLSTAFDLSTASYDSVSFSVNSQENLPTNLVFNNNGTKMYVVGYGGDNVYQYTTSATIAARTLDLSTGSVFEITPTADTQIGLSNPAASGTVSAATLIIKEPTPLGYDMSETSFVDRTSHSLSNTFAIRFKSDGTKVYFSPYYSGAYGITEHTLSTAWDITTLNATPSAFYNSDGSNNILDFFFKPDGTKLYTMGYSQDRVYQHSLSTAWDITTASSDSKSAYVGSQDSTPHSLYFKSDGTKFYMSGNSTVLNEYTMSTAWDVSTASYTQKSGNLTGSTQYAIDFIPDGTKVYMMGASGVLYGYNLSTAWDSTTLDTSYFLSYDAQTAALGSRPYALTFGDSGKYWYGMNSSFAFQFNSYVMPSLTYNSSVQFAGGTAPTSPALGETDVLTFTTRDGGTTYSGILGIDGAK